eukprot:1410337-Rhodomonas_salina.2
MSVTDVSGMVLPGTSPLDGFAAGASPPGSGSLDGGVKWTEMLTNPRGSPGMKVDSSSRSRARSLSSLLSLSPSLPLSLSVPLLIS